MRSKQVTSTASPDGQETPAEQGFLSVEVLALLAKHELRTALEQMVGRSAEDEHVPVVQRPRQEQRRLAADQIDEVVARYVDGASIDALAREYGINRTTVISHLERNGVERRRNPRKMTDAMVWAAADRYATGMSLTAVAGLLQVRLTSHVWGCPTREDGCHAKEVSTRVQG